MIWKYLKYLIRHKWYVLVECWKHGLYWRGITHDLSKLRPSEFMPYARFFYGDYPTAKEALTQFSGYTRTREMVDAEFDFAWLLHQKRNPHHWQYYILREDDGGLKMLDMPESVIKEMVCDWVGAGKALGFKWDGECRDWYKQNRGKIFVPPNTRKRIECLLDFKPPKDNY